MANRHAWLMAAWCVGAAPVLADMALEREVVVADQNVEEYLPRVARDSARDEYLVVWEHRRFVAVDPVPFRSIMGRRFDRYGRALGGPLQLTPDDFHDRRQPDVVHDATADRYLLVYAYASQPGDSSASPVDWDVRALRLGGDGAPEGDEVEISATVNDETVPRVAVTGPLPAGPPRYLVVWSHQSFVGGRLVRGALFPWAAAPSPFTLGEPADRTSPDVAWASGDGNFLVVSSDTRDVFARTVSSGGAVGSEVTVAASTAAEAAPAVESCDPESFLVSWQAQAAAAVSEVAVRRLRGDGVALGPPTPVAAGPASERRPAIGCARAPVGASGQGEAVYLVTFELQFGDGSGAYGVGGVCVDGGGLVVPTFEVEAVPPAGTGVTFHPAVAGGTAGWFVVWEHQRQFSPSSLDIHARAVWQLFAEGFEFGDAASWSSVVP